MKTKLIRVNLKKVETLYITRCPDLIGLLVAARTREEVVAELPRVIAEMLMHMLDGGKFVVLEAGNPEVLGYEHVFAAIPQELIK